jgi:hypothetical protein
LTAKRY